MMSVDSLAIRCCISLLLGHNFYNVHRYGGLISSRTFRVDVCMMNTRSLVNKLLICDNEILTFVTQSIGRIDLHEVGMSWLQ